MEQLVAVERNRFGDIISFQTSNGRIISYQKAIMDVENGLIDGVTIVEQEQDEGSSYYMFENNFDDYPLL